MFNKLDYKNLKNTDYYYRFEYLQKLSDGKFYDGVLSFYPKTFDAKFISETNKLIIIFGSYRGKAPSHGKIDRWGTMEHLFVYDKQKNKCLVNKWAVKTDLKIKTIKNMFKYLLNCLVNNKPDENIVNIKFSLIK